MTVAVLPLRRAGCGLPHVPAQWLAAYAPVDWSGGGSAPAGAFSGR